MEEVVKGSVVRTERAGGSAWTTDNHHMGVGPIYDVFLENCPLEYQPSYMALLLSFQGMPES